MKTIDIASKNIGALYDADFEKEILESDKPVLVDFWAEWCHPCKIMAPTLDTIAGEFDGRLRVGKLNVDDNPFTTERYGIRGIPSLVLFKEGRLVRQITGVRSTEVIRQILNQAL